MTLRPPRFSLYAGIAHPSPLGEAQVKHSATHVGGISISVGREYWYSLRTVPRRITLAFAAASIRRGWHGSGASAEAHAPARCPDAPTGRGGSEAALRSRCYAPTTHSLPSFLSPPARFSPRLPTASPSHPTPSVSHNRRKAVCLTHWRPYRTSLAKRNLLVRGGALPYPCIFRKSKRGGAPAPRRAGGGASDRKEEKFPLYPFLIADLSACYDFDYWKITKKCKNMLSESMKPSLNFSLLSVPENALKNI